MILHDARREHGDRHVAARNRLRIARQDPDAKPSLANEDPDANGVVILAPEDWDSVKGSLAPGSEVAGPFEAKMDEDGFAGCG